MMVHGRQAPNSDSAECMLMFYVEFIEAFASIIIMGINFNHWPNQLLFVFSYT